MLFNHIDSIDNEGGQYLVLTDYRTEGIAVSSQHETLEEALLAFGADFPQAIVMVPEIQFSVSGIDHNE